MKTNDNTNRLKTYKIKNHDSGKTYSVKAVSYTDAKMKYNNHILKDAKISKQQVVSVLNSAGLRPSDYEIDSDNFIVLYTTIKQHKAVLMLEKAFGESSVEFTKDDGVVEIKGFVKDSITEDGEIAGWIAIYNGTKIEIKKSEADSLYAAKKLAILKFKEKFKNVKEHMISIAPGYNDSITEDADKSMGTYKGYTIKQNVDGDIYVLKKSGEKEFFESWKKAYEAIKTGTIKDSVEDSIKTYKIKNHDSGQTFRVKAESYTDAIKKYNKHILKDSLTEDANESQYFEQAKQLRGKELTQGRYAGYRIRRVTKSVTGKLWYLISDGLNDRTISHDEMLKGMNARNIDLFDSITEDATDEYTAEKYKGTEWGVFAKRSRAWVAFGTKEKMTELAKRLNESEKKQHQDSITEDADIAQNDIKSSYLPEDANADNIQYLGFNEKRKLSFYGYGDRYFVHYDLEGRTEEIDKATVQKILKKNILGEIDENDLINKEPQAEEIVSDAFTEDTTVADKLIGNGEVHFRYKGGRVITGAWNKNKLNEREISSILNKYNCKREQERWNDIVFSTRIGNEENLCKAFNEINPSYSVSELLSLHDSKERGDR